MLEEMKMAGTGDHCSEQVCIRGTGLLASVLWVQVRLQLPTVSMDGTNSRFLDPTQRMGPSSPSSLMTFFAISFLASLWPWFLIFANRKWLKNYQLAQARIACVYVVFSFYCIVFRNENIVTCSMCVALDGVLDNWIYWPLAGRNYK
jgi:hypothetical protein